MKKAVTVQLSEEPHRRAGLNLPYGLVGALPRAELLQKAVTFVELFIVIIIIGILAGLSLPKLKTAADNIELENFVKEIYYLSRYLQGSAAAQGKIFQLSIDKNKGEFQAAYEQAGEFKNLGGRFGKIYKAPAGAQVSLSPAEKTAVYFYPDGAVEQIKITFANEHKKEFSLFIQGAAGEIKIQ